jgi:DNA-directed RNA polymerase specialized sigma24 family protein
MNSAYTLSPSSETEQKIIFLLKKKGKEGFDLLYDTYSVNLYTLCLNITGSKTMAEEVLENTCLFIWQNIHAYHPSEGSFGVWLVGIVKQEASKKMNSAIG